MKFNGFKSPCLGVFSNLSKAALLFGVLLFGACDSNSGSDRGNDTPGPGADSPNTPNDPDTSPALGDRKGSEETLRFAAYLLIEHFMMRAEEISGLAESGFPGGIEFWPVGVGDPDADGVYTRNCLLDGTSTYQPTEDPKGLIVENFACREHEPEGLRTANGKLTVYEQDPPRTGFSFTEVYLLDDVQEDILFANDSGSTMSRLTGEEERSWSHGMGVFKTDTESDGEMICGEARAHIELTTQGFETEWHTAGSISLATTGDLELGGESFTHSHFQVSTEEPLMAPEDYSFGNWAFYQGKARLENHEGAILELEFVQGGVYINEDFYSGDELLQDELWAFSSVEACLAFVGGEGQWEPPTDPGDGTGSPEDPLDGDWTAQVSGSINVASGESDGATAFMLETIDEPMLSISGSLGRTSQFFGLEIVLLTPLSGEGEYDLVPIGEQADLTQLILGGVVDNNNDYRQWSISAEGGSGILTVTEYLPDRIKGYLNGTLYPLDFSLESPSDADPVTITAEFDLPLPSLGDL